MAASLQRFRLRASVRPRLPCIPRRTHAYCVAARTQASCVAARATVLALAAGAWRHRKQPALCEPPPPPPPLPPLETALAPVASEQPLPLARRLARVAFYALRAAYLWLVFSPLLLSSPLAFWQRRFPQLEEVWWSWCIATLERTGALAIKLAQWASSRPDLFSSRVCGRLQHLQDHTQPHSLEATEAALDAAFGPGWRSVLRIAPHPVGSGCIAQVHRGELLRDGEWGPVAVKVLHPQVGRYIRADGALLRLVCGGLQRLPRVRWLNPGGMSEEFTEMLLRQLDLRRKKKADSPRSQEHTCPPHPVPTRAPLGARRTTCAASAPTSRARGAVPRRSTSRIRSAGTWRGPLSVVSCEARSEAGRSLEAFP
uniref:ABC1 atypical kinase-like domain-containing protein n=1 Tax=Emiliania huxleyi TaxID=2903 RepID=A0A7S3STA1_EMIHU